MRTGLWTILLFVACIGSAVAAGPGAVRKQVESSMLVTGTIDILADGSVAGHALPGSKGLTSDLVGFIDRNVSQWRFEPIELDPGARSARAKMSLRLVLKKLDDGKATVEIRGAQFGGSAQPQESLSAAGRMTPPSYPKNAARAGVGGTVYLVVKVGRDGRVADVVAEQVNMYVITNETAMQNWRDMLAKSAMRAARTWTFTPPTQGDYADEPHWSARVPVDFVMDGVKQAKEGEWESYVPGPRALIPWRSGDDGVGADAVASGGVHPIGNGPRLLSKLSGA